MDLVKALEAFRERCASEADREAGRARDAGAEWEAAEWSATYIRKIDVIAWLASQPAIDVGPRVCGAKHPPGSNAMCELPDWHPGEHAMLLERTDGGPRCALWGEPLRTHDTGPRVCVAALVTDSLGRVLLVRSRRREGWEMPGGKKRTGESWRASVAREVLEETGLPVVIVGHDAIDAGPGDGLSCDSLIFIAFCSATPSEPKAGSDAIDAQWFAPDALPDLANLPTTRLLREWAGAW